MPDAPWRDHASCEAVLRAGSSHDSATRGSSRRLFHLAQRGAQGIDSEKSKVSHFAGTLHSLVESNVGLGKSGGLARTGFITRQNCLVRARHATCQ